MIRSTIRFMFHVVFWSLLALLLIYLFTSRYPGDGCTFNKEANTLYTTSCNSVTLSNTIGPSYLYEELAQDIEESDDKAYIKLNLGGLGGSVGTLMLLSNVIQVSKAPVIANVRTNVYSAHAHLVCEADHAVIPDNVLLMFHSVQVDTDSKEAELAARLAFSGQHALLLEECYKKGILTPSEIHRVLKGEDVYTSGHNINMRRLLGITEYPGVE